MATTPHCYTASVALIVSSWLIKLIVLAMVLAPLEANRAEAEAEALAEAGAQRKLERRRLCGLQP